MVSNFKNIEYLKNGNERQKLAYSDLIELRVFEKLRKYHPILTGTIPIEIDVPESDLDVIYECNNHQEFSIEITELLGNKPNFKISTSEFNGNKVTIAAFNTPNFIVEIFGQNTPTDQQNAYKHMLIEFSILASKGAEFKKQIIQLKSTGLKTEPAFAKELNLTCDPYKELLKLEKYYLKNSKTI